MAIGNLGNKVSSDDIARAKDIRNPPEFEPGFEDDGGSGTGFDDFFDDFEFDSTDTFGDTGGGGSGTGSNPFSESPSGFGSTGGFGSPIGGAGTTPGSFGSPIGGGAGGFGSPFGNPFGQQQPQQAPPKEDAMDKMMEATGVAMMSGGQILLEIFKSMGSRNADDIAYLSRNILMTGGFLSITSVILGIVGLTTKVRFISFGGLPGETIFSGLLLISTGLMGMALTAIKIAKANKSNERTVSELPDVQDYVEDDIISDYESNIDDILNDLFDDEDSLFDELDNLEFGDDEEEESESYEPDFSEIEFKPEEINYEDKIEDLQENQFMTREQLYRTFKPFFPNNTPTFADRSEIDIYSEDFATIETICLKALANVCRCEMEDVDSKLESAHETYFSYELRMKRVRGVNRVDDIAREMEAYFRESSTDTSVNATVDIEGDFYTITVTKGASAIVTFGDILDQDYVEEFMLDTGKKLPIIVGVDELGRVELADAKHFDAMMIVGKARSGKSWYVLSIILAMMMFNRPEEVQFIIIDPKESNLFNTMRLLPHVTGLHNGEDIISIMNTIINEEGERRAKILKDHRCDDIWELREKGIDLPILYLVIDEVVTVINNLAAKGNNEDKEFNKLMLTLITKLPYVGIRLIMIPHRATGIVDKTNRSMIQFTAAVRADSSDVCETLGIKKWDRALKFPGDTALKTADMEDAKFIKGASVTTSNAQNADLITNAARAFYKMGVDMPDMTNLGHVRNRNENEIREELDLNNDRIQYDATNILKDL